MLQIRAIHFFALLIAVVLLVMPTVSHAAESAELHQGNISGDSGWDLYDDEEDEDLEARALEQAKLEKEKEDLARKQRRSEDFFAIDSDVFDKSISRTHKEEKAAKRSSKNKKSIK